MNYAIIGFGEIGQTLARAFARTSTYPSQAAATRDLAAAAAIGPGVIPKSLRKPSRQTSSSWLSGSVSTWMSRRRCPAGRGRHRRCDQRIRRSH